MRPTTALSVVTRSNMEQCVGANGFLRGYISVVYPAGGVVAVVSVCGNVVSSFSGRLIG